MELFKLLSQFNFINDSLTLLSSNGLNSYTYSAFCSFDKNNVVPSVLINVFCESAVSCFILNEDEVNICKITVDTADRKLSDVGLLSQTIIQHLPHNIGSTSSLSSSYFLSEVEGCSIPSSPMGLAWLESRNIFVASWATGDIYLCESPELNSTTKLTVDPITWSTTTLLNSDVLQTDLAPLHYATLPQAANNYPSLDLSVFRVNMKGKCMGVVNNSALTCSSNLISTALFSTSVVLSTDLRRLFLSSGNAFATLYPSLCATVISSSGSYCYEYTSHSEVVTYEVVSGLISSIIGIVFSKGFDIPYSILKSTYLSGATVQSINPPATTTTSNLKCDFFQCSSFFYEASGSSSCMGTTESSCTASGYVFPALLSLGFSFSTSQRASLIATFSLPLTDSSVTFPISSLSLASIPYSIYFSTFDQVCYSGFKTPTIDGCGYFIPSTTASPSGFLSGSLSCMWPYAPVSSIPDPSNITSSDALVRCKSDLMAELGSSVVESSSSSPLCELATCSNTVTAVETIAWFSSLVVPSTNYILSEINFVSTFIGDTTLTSVSFTCQETKTSSPKPSLIANYPTMHLDVSSGTPPSTFTVDFQCINPGFPSTDSANPSHPSGVLRPVSPSPFSSSSVCIKFCSNSLLTDGVWSDPTLTVFLNDSLPAYSCNTGFVANPAVSADTTCLDPDASNSATPAIYGDGYSLCVLAKCLSSQLVTDLTSSPSFDNYLPTSFPVDFEIDAAVTITLSCTSPSVFGNEVILSPDWETSVSVSLTCSLSDSFSSGGAFDVAAATASYACTAICDDIQFAGSLSTPIDATLAQRATLVSVSTSQCDAGFTTGSAIPISFSCTSSISGDAPAVWQPSSSPCVDLDECVSATHDCDTLNGFSCANSLGSFTCSCASGKEVMMTESVSVCDVNECSSGAHNCNWNAFCTNSIGSFSCTCSSDFIGDGVSCVKISCIDGIRNGDETGIDCGESCSTACATCPSPPSAVGVSSSIIGTSVFYSCDDSSLTSSFAFSICNSSLTTAVWVPAVAPSCSQHVICPTGLVEAGNGVTGCVDDSSHPFAASPLPLVIQAANFYLSDSFFLTASDLISMLRVFDESQISISLSFPGISSTVDYFTCVYLEYCGVVSKGYSTLSISVSDLSGSLSRTVQLEVIVVPEGASALNPLILIGKPFLENDNVVTNTTVSYDPCVYGTALCPRESICYYVTPSSDNHALHDCVCQASGLIFDANLNVCKLDFSAVDPATTAEVDECSTGSHHCHPAATCTDSSNLYSCECNSGYIGDGFSACKASAVLAELPYLPRNPASNVDLYLLAQRYLCVSSAFLAELSVNPSAYALSSDVVLFSNTILNGLSTYSTSVVSFSLSADVDDPKYFSLAMQTFALSFGPAVESIAISALRQLDTGSAVSQELLLIMPEVLDSLMKFSAVASTAVELEMALRVFGYLNEPVLLKAAAREDSFESQLAIRELISETALQVVGKYFNLLVNNNNETLMNALFASAESPTSFIKELSSVTISFAKESAKVQIEDWEVTAPMNSHLENLNPNTCVFVVSILCWKRGNLFSDIVVDAKDRPEAVSPRASNSMLSLNMHALSFSSDAPFTCQDVKQSTRLLSTGSFAESYVINYSVRTQRPFQEPPIVLKMPLERLNNTDFEYRGLCGFYSPESKNMQFTGCLRVKYQESEDDNHLLCECNHMTDFGAILRDVVMQTNLTIFNRISDLQFNSKNVAFWLCLSFCILTILLLCRGAYRDWMEPITRSDLIYLFCNDCRLLDVVKKKHMFDDDDSDLRKKAEEERNLLKTNTPSLNSSLSKGFERESNNNNNDNNNYNKIAYNKDKDKEGVYVSSFITTAPSQLTSFSTNKEENHADQNTIFNNTTSMQEVSDANNTANRFNLIISQRNIDSRHTSPSPLDLNHIFSLINKNNSSQKHIENVSSMNDDFLKNSLPISMTANTLTSATTPPSIILHNDKQVQSLMGDNYPSYNPSISNSVCAEVSSNSVNRFRPREIVSSPSHAASRFSLNTSEDDTNLPMILLRTISPETNNSTARTPYFPVSPSMHPSDEENASKISVSLLKYTRAKIRFGSQTREADGYYEEAIARGALGLRDPLPSFSPAPAMSPLHEFHLPLDHRLGEIQVKPYSEIKRQNDILDQLQSQYIRNNNNNSNSNTGNAINTKTVNNKDCRYHASTFHNSPSQPAILPQTSSMLASSLRRRTSVDVGQSTTRKKSTLDMDTEEKVTISILSHSQELPYTALTIKNSSIMTNDLTLHNENNNYNNFNSSNNIADSQAGKYEASNLLVDDDVTPSSNERLLAMLALPSVSPHILEREKKMVGLDSYHLEIKQKYNSQTLSDQSTTQHDHSNVICFESDLPESDDLLVRSHSLSNESMNGSQFSSGEDALNQMRSAKTELRNRGRRIRKMSWWQIFNGILSFGHPFLYENSGFKISSLQSTLNIVCAIIGVLFLLAVFYGVTETRFEDVAEGQKQPIQIEPDVTIFLIPLPWDMSKFGPFSYKGIHLTLKGLLSSIFCWMIAHIIPEVLSWSTYIKSPYLERLAQDRHKFGFYIRVSDGLIPCTLMTLDEQLTWCKKVERRKMFGLIFGFYYCTFCMIFLFLFTIALGSNLDNDERWLSTSEFFFTAIFTNLLNLVVWPLGVTILLTFLFKYAYRSRWFNRCLLFIPSLSNFARKDIAHSLKDGRRDKTSKSKPSKGDQYNKEITEKPKHKFDVSSSNSQQSSTDATLSKTHMFSVSQEMTSFEEFNLPNTASNNNSIRHMDDIATNTEKTKLLAALGFDFEDDDDKDKEHHLSPEKRTKTIQDLETRNFCELHPDQAVTRDVFNFSSTSLKNKIDLNKSGTINKQSLESTFNNGIPQSHEDAHKQHQDIFQDDYDLEFDDFKNCHPPNIHLVGDAPNFQHQQKSHADSSFSLAVKWIKKLNQNSHFRDRRNEEISINKNNEWEHYNQHLTANNDLHSDDFEMRRQLYASAPLMHASLVMQDGIRLQGGLSSSGGDGFRRQLRDAQYELLLDFDALRDVAFDLHLPDEDIDIFGELGSFIMHAPHHAEGVHVQDLDNEDWFLNQEFFYPTDSRSGFDDLTLPAKSNVEAYGVSSMNGGDTERNKMSLKRRDTEFDPEKGVQA